MLASRSQPRPSPRPSVVIAGGPRPAPVPLELEAGGPHDGRPVPMHAPATTSLAQWAPRYVRLIAISGGERRGHDRPARPPAGAPARARRRARSPSPTRRWRGRTGTRPSRVAISAPGGRGRSISALSGPMHSSDVTTAPRNAPSCSQRRCHASAPITTRRSGTITSGPPSTLSTSADPGQPRRADVGHPGQPTVVDALQRRAVRSTTTTTVSTAATASSTSPATSACRRRSNIERDACRSSDRAARCPCDRSASCGAPDAWRSSSVCRQLRFARQNTQQPTPSGTGSSQVRARYSSTAAAIWFFVPSGSPAPSAAVRPSSTRPSPPGRDRHGREQADERERGEHLLPARPRRRRRRRGAGRRAARRTARGG